MTFKFAHMADLHIGAFTNPKLLELQIQAFTKAIDICIAQNVNFILISGDLLDSNIPNLRTVQEGVKVLKIAKDAKIPIYVIHGGHDASASQISMINILESAGLIDNVTKAVYDKDKKITLNFTIDPNTGVKLVGMSGRSLSLEKHLYEKLNLEKLEKEDGFKIFAFHIAIDELKPINLARMDSVPIGLFPKGFSYYAGGHIHENIKEFKEEYGVFVYPGPIFAGNIRDFEATAKGKRRGIYIIEVEDNTPHCKFHETMPIEFQYLEYNANYKTVQTVINELEEFILNQNVKKKFVVFKISGVLSSGKSSDINFSQIRQKFSDLNAEYILIHRSQLKSKKLETIMVSGFNREEIEQKLLKENVDSVSVKIKKLKAESGAKISYNLLNVVRQPQLQNEHNKDYEERILEEVKEILELREVLK